MTASFNLDEILDKTLNGREGADNLRQKKNSVVLRTSLNGRNFILKFYDCASFRNILRRIGESETFEQGFCRLLSGLRGLSENLKQANPAKREYAALRLLRGKGCKVPEPYGLHLVGRRSPDYTHVLPMEDLGGCLVAEKIREFIRDGKSDQLHALEQQVIDLTHEILRCGVIDSDYGTHNLIYTDGGEVYKIDLEYSNIITSKPIDKYYSMTLASLIARYALETGADRLKVKEFSQRLLARFPESKKVLPKIAACARQKAGMWARVKGVAIESSLPDFE